jgi:hypothetical protein
VLARLPPDNAAALTEPIVPRWSAALPNRGLAVIRTETELTQVRRMELLQSDDGAAVAVASARATFRQVR